jgi:hypothetical protein
MIAYISYLPLFSAGFPATPAVSHNFFTLWQQEPSLANSQACHRLLISANKSSIYPGE